MSNIFFTSNNVSGGTIVASATGHDGVAHGTISGASVNDTIRAIATSATTQAIINLEGSVTDGSVTATGNAQIYIDGATISGTSLQTIGPAAAIGVFGGGSATVVGAVVSKGSFISDDGALTFSGGAAQAGVTFLASGTDPLATGVGLTLSNTTFGGSDRLVAEQDGLLVVSAASGGTITFSAGTIVGATANGTVQIYGGVANFGTMEALALGGDEVEAYVVVSGGTGDTFTNAKGALVEAQAIFGFSGSASVNISVGSSVINSGTMLASAGAGVENSAVLSIAGGSFINEKGAKVVQSVAANGVDNSLHIFGSSGVTNLGAITGTASHDSQTNSVTIDTDGGPIVNSGTISVAATTNSQEGLLIGDGDAAGGSLTNAKGASIAVSATTGSEVYVSMAINSAGTLTNSGTMSFAANNDSSVDVNGIAVGAVVNFGTIVATAANGATADFLMQMLGSGGGLTNSGKIDAIGSNDGGVSQTGLFGGSGSLLNTGIMQAVATGDSEVKQGWIMNSYGTLSGGNFTNAAKATMGASATNEGSADFNIDYYTSASNSGTIAATASNRGNAYADFENGGTFTNNSIVTVSAVLDSTADIEITAYGSGGSGASIVNAGTMTAVGNTPADASLTLDAYNSGATISNTGSITAMAISGGLAEVDLGAFGNHNGGSGTITNSNLIGAIADGGHAFLDVETTGSGSIITNSKIIEAVANGGTAYTRVGGGNFSDSVVNNSGGTLLAKETAGTAYLDIGDYGANVSGGTLTTVGPNAYLGVFQNNASLAEITITAKSQIVGWDGTLNIDDIVGSVSAGTLVEAAKSGEVNIIGNLSNSGTIEALSNDDDSAFVFMTDGTGSGSIVNSGTIEASITAGYEFTSASAYMNAGNVINAKGATIEVVATAESFNTGNDVGVFASSILNSGTILASASGSSEDYVTVEGDSITNAATGKIEAVAASQSRAWVNVVGNATNAGLIEAQADTDSTASVYFSGTVSNTGGTIEAAGNAAIYLGAENGDYSTTVVGGLLKTIGTEAAAFVTDDSSATLSAVDIVSGSLVLVSDDSTLTLENGTVIGNNKSGNDAAVVDAYSSTSNVVVGGTVYNSGLLVAGGGEAGGTVTISSGGVVSGAGGIGWVTINELGTVDVLSGGSANVAFGAATSGTLEIADAVGSASVYGGVVAGFGGIGGEYPGQFIELANGDAANVSAYSASYSLVTPNANPNLDIGTLTVTSSGGTAAVITLEGNYVSGATFTVFGDGSNIGIYDPGATVMPASTLAATLASTANPPPSLINYAGTSNVALLGNYMASMFAATEGGVTPTGGEGAQNQTALAAVHHA